MHFCIAKKQSQTLIWLAKSVNFASIILGELPVLRVSFGRSSAKSKKLHHSVIHGQHFIYTCTVGLGNFDWLDTSLSYDDKYRFVLTSLITNTFDNRVQDRHVQIDKLYLTFGRRGMKWYLLKIGLASVKYRPMWRITSKQASSCFSSIKHISL